MIAALTVDQFRALFGGVLGLAVLALIVMISILWIILPFAIFGIKPLLRDLIHEVRESRVDARRRSRHIDFGRRTDRGD